MVMAASKPELALRKVLSLYHSQSKSPKKCTKMKLTQTHSHENKAQEIYI